MGTTSGINASIYFIPSNFIFWGGRDILCAIRIRPLLNLPRARKQATTSSDQGRGPIQPCGEARVGLFTA